MTEIVVKCAGALAAATVKGALTSGARGIPVQVALNEEWADLVPMLVAVCGDECREMVIDSTGKSVLPWECLIPGEKLRIGVRGLNRDGSVMIPTAWAACGVVRSSVNDADPEESSPAPSPALVEQINALAFKSSQEAQTAKETAAELVRRADAGELDGAPGPAGPQGPQGETGPIGPQGEKGRDGVTPNIQIGTVRTVSSDTPAAVRRTGTDANPVLEFDIPKGEKGEDGRGGSGGQSIEVDATLTKPGAAADAAAAGAAINKNVRSINALYKLYKGQSYDIETAEESGRNEAPSGAEYMSLAEIHGRTEQASNPSPDSPAPIHSVESIHILHTDADGNTLNERTITPPRPFNAIRQYKDKLDIENGFWEYNTNTVTLEGDETWLAASSVVPNTYRYYWNNAPFRNSNELGGREICAMCDIAKPMNWFGVYAEDKTTLNGVTLYQAGGADDKRLVFRTTIATLDEFKAYLHSNKPKAVALCNPESVRIDTADLEWLRSLELVPATDRIAVTDQDGQDVPWLNEYIINLREVTLNG